MINPKASHDRPIGVLPRWLLRHIVRAENHRHAQRKPKFFPGEVGYYNRGPAHYNAGSVHDYPVRVWDYKTNRYIDKPRETPIGVEQVAILDTNDYRLWAQVRWPSQNSSSQLVMARCRWCHERFPLREFKQVRKTHKERCNFTHNLREVFQILLQRGQCTVCNRHTTAQRWGIPLCGEVCEKIWMFATDHSQRLGCAIIDARIAKRIRENENPYATIQN